MPDLNPHCRVLNCIVPPTHVLVTPPPTYQRRAVPYADLMPGDPYIRITEGPPGACWCQPHAEERANHGY